MYVGKICSREVDTADSEEAVHKVAQRMHARKVGTLVVVNAANEPIGIITDRDLAMRVLAVGSDPARTTVRDVMTAHPVTIRVDATTKDAIKAMRSNLCRRIPVVDGSGKLTGLLSLDDILEQLTEELQMISSLIQEESPQSLSNNF